MNASNASYRALFGSEDWVGQKNLDPLVIVPTHNEAGNIEMRLERIQHAFAGVSFAGSSHEVVFVDASTDDTPSVVESAASHFPERPMQLQLPESRATTDSIRSN